MLSERMSVVKIMQRQPRVLDQASASALALSEPVDEIPLNRGPFRGEVRFARRPLRISPPFVPRDHRVKDAVSVTSTVAALCTECKCLFICDKEPGPDYVCQACIIVASMTDFLLDDIHSDPVAEKIL